LSFIISGAVKVAASAALARPKERATPRRFLMVLKIALELPPPAQAP
jgi:hypothetical protein